MTDEMILAPTPARRFLALTALLGLAVFCFAFAVQGGVLFWPMGLLAAWGAYWFYTSTRDTLILRSDGIYLQSGPMLVAMDDIVKIDRGMFAMKPTNGFALVLKTPGPRRFAPGLYWQLGRRLGIGGVTPPAAGKLMAETLASRLHDGG